MHQVAAPTGARGSVLLMSGGIIVLGFLFLAFLFRSAIVGDLAPVANAQAPLRRVAAPGELPVARAMPVPPGAFDAGREAGHAGPQRLDAAFDALRSRGVDARVVGARAGWKLVRLYACASCGAGASARGCEHERGLLAGTFERLAGGLVTVHEVGCRNAGDAFCAFEVRHAPEESP